MNTRHAESSEGILETEAQGPTVHLDWLKGAMKGAPVLRSEKTLGELEGLFHDVEAQVRMSAGAIVYVVQWWQAAAAGEAGGLLWGVTIVKPGKVGDEFFMTHGHFHADRTRAEYYVTASGHGVLVRMDDSRSTWGEAMSPGSVHYINGQHAHRVVNTGDEPLIFWACWGADAGYDYGTIREHGFGARVVERAGRPALVPNE
jgi:glucose-6-phosphate isomerase